MTKPLDPFEILIKISKILCNNSIFIRKFSKILNTFSARMLSGHVLRWSSPARSGTRTTPAGCTDNRPCLLVSWSLGRTDKFAYKMIKNISIRYRIFYDQFSVSILLQNVMLVDLLIVLQLNRKTSFRNGLFSFLELICNVYFSKVLYFKIPGIPNYWE